MPAAVAFKPRAYTPATSAEAPDFTFSGNSWLTKTGTADTFRPVNLNVNTGLLLNNALLLSSVAAGC